MAKIFSFYECLQLKFVILTIKLLYLYMDSMTASYRNTKNSVIPLSTHVLNEWKAEVTYKKKEKLIIQSGDYYTSADLKRAYFQGKVELLNNIEKLLLEKLDYNMQIVTTITDNLIKKINKHNLKIEKICLKLESYKIFELLFLLEESSYDNPKLIVNLYNITKNIKLKYNNTNFDIDISFMPKTENTDFEYIDKDGFDITYGER